MWSSICSGEHASEYLLSLEMIKIMDGTQITDRQTDSQPASHPAKHTQFCENENEKEIPI